MVQVMTLVFNNFRFLWYPVQMSPLSINLTVVCCSCDPGQSDYIAQASWVKDSVAKMSKFLAENQSI
jgi:hypothetical protein